METKELLLKLANEMFLQGELPQEFIENDLPIEFLHELRTKIYLDLNIMLPGKMESDMRKLLLLMVVLNAADAELHETDAPNVYRLYVKETNGKIYVLDELTEIENYLLQKLSLFLKSYYEAKENKVFKFFKAEAEFKLREWNNNGIPPQERVFKLSRTKSIPEIMSETGFDEKDIRDALEDYEIRMNRKKLKNVKRFEKKILNQISKLPEEKQYIIDYYRLLLDEIANGGINIEEPEDLFPKQIPLFKKPNSLFYN